MARKKINIKPKSGKSGSGQSPVIRNRNTNKPYNQPTKVPDIKAPGKIEPTKPKKKRAPEKKKSGCGFVFLSVIIIGSLVYFLFFYEGEIPKLGGGEEQTEFVEVVDDRPTEYPFEINDYNERNLEVETTMSFITVLNDANLSKRTIDKIRPMLRQKFKKTRVDKGVFRIFTNKKSSKTEYVVYEPMDDDAVCIRTKTPPEVLLIKRDYDPQIVQKALIINNADKLEWEFGNAGFPPDFLDEFEDMLKYTVDFYGIVDRDRFKVIYEEIRLNNKPVGVKKILACEFQLTQQDKVINVYGIETSEGIEYFDGNNASVERQFLKAPLKAKFRISSPFGQRSDPLQKNKGQFHKGTDFAAPTGTPIFAIGDGKIIRKRVDQKGGQYIRIQHDGNRYESTYLHMSEWAPGIEEGVRVKKGQAIGKVGATGERVTGPHLCLRMYDNKQSIDFFSAEFLAEKFINRNQRSLFEKNKKDYQNRMDKLSY